jgi:hypothetical protein
MHPGALAAAAGKCGLQPFHRSALSRNPTVRSMPLLRILLECGKTLVSKRVTASPLLGVRPFRHRHAARTPRLGWASSMAWISR